VKQLVKKYARAMLVAVALSAVIWPAAAFAVEPKEMLSDPALEARARALSRELRCLVCQNESIDDSGAPLAHDIRVLVRERIKAGDTDRQVIDFLVARYGEFVLLRPPLSWHTAALWGLHPRDGRDGTPPRRSPRDGHAHAGRRGARRAIAARKRLVSRRLGRRARELPGSTATYHSHINILFLLYNYRNFQTLRSFNAADRAR
jgi:cytochrome c-type biogenesis protein CcmH